MSDEPKLKLAQLVVLPVITSLNLPTERLLQAAMDHKLGSVVIIGYDTDGEFYFASSEASGPSVLWDLEMAKKKLLEVSIDP
jgi:hypothetical protein